MPQILRFDVVANPAIDPTAYFSVPKSWWGHVGNNSSAQLGAAAVVGKVQIFLSSQQLRRRINGSCHHDTLLSILHPRQPIATRGRPAAALVDFCASLYDRGG